MAICGPFGNESDPAISMGLTFHLRQAHHKMTSNADKLTHSDTETPTTSSESGRPVCTSVAHKNYIYFKSELSRY